MQTKTAQFTITRINEDVRQLSLGGFDSHVYLVRRELLIDATSGLHPERLFAALENLGLKPQKIKSVVLTHAHFDHIGGARLFPKSKLMIHAEDAPVLEKKDALASYAVFFGADLKDARPPDVRLGDGENIVLGGARGLKLRVIHTPGHTAGSICVYEPKAQLLFTGDTIFARNVGRTDLLGARPAELRGSLEKLAALDVKKILPAHGAIVADNGGKHIKDILGGIKAKEILA